MIKSAQLGKEIRVRVVNKIGVLADMSKLLAEHGINIDAVAGYESGNEAYLILVAGDTLRASDALKKAGYKSLAETDCIILELENKPGALKHITTALAREEIDIKQIYGTTCSYGCPARIVLTTGDNEKALVVFNKSKK